MANKRTSKAAQRKKSCQMRTDCSANDQISQLPDEVLLIILSFLSVKDAIVTSGLSRRWRNLWMNNTGCWNLEFPEKTKGTIARDYRNYQRLYHSEILKHTERITRALELHRGQHLDELRIGAYRDTCPPTQIYKWINFAIEKGVKSFELKFDTAGLIPWSRYNFPNVENFANLLDDKTSEGQLHHPSRVNPEKHQFRSFCCLKSLSLAFFDVGEEIIYYFLSNCMFLEFLHVEGSDTLLNLEVADGLRLKCLEIVRCFNIKSLKIYAKKLLSFVYIGPTIDVPFQNVPLNLLELTIGDKYGESFAFQHYKHNYVSQIETLKFAATCKVHAFLCRVPYIFPEMINLKHLELHVPIGKSLLGYTTFLIASPFLSTLKMEYRLRRSFVESGNERQKREEYDRRHEDRKFPHQHLQKVELIGFHDEVTDVRFAIHMLGIAVYLKKMVLRFRHHSGNQEAFRNVETKLKELLPSGAELVLLKT